MDRRINYLMGLDTETCNGLIIDDKVDLSQSIVYDIGWVVTDKQGRIYETRSFLIYEVFWEDVKNYNIRVAFAHNAMFDYRALNNTIRWITKSKKRFFFPRKIEMWDTLKMARQTIGKQKSYRKYCEINNFVTKHKVPQPRLTAEILYRYITGDVTFEENHTGLEDVMIETKILVHCFRQHKKMEKRLFVKAA